MPDLNLTIPYKPYRPISPLFHNLTGKRFGRLTVFGIYGTQKQRVFWLCRCDCGTWTSAVSSNLSRGQTQSCRCLGNEHLKSAVTTHGARRTKLYYAYTNAKTRCTNPNYYLYHRYGGRGIEFRFTSFEQFRNDLGDPPSPQHSINRINNDGHYEPGNVEWTVSKTQARNTARNRPLTINGRTQPMCQWAEETKLQVQTIWNRLQLGWCDSCSISTIKWHHCSHQRPGTDADDPPDLWGVRRQ